MVVVFDHLLDVLVVVVVHLLFQYFDHHRHHHFVVVVDFSWYFLILLVNVKLIDEIYFDLMKYFFFGRPADLVLLGERD